MELKNLKIVKVLNHVVEIEDQYGEIMRCLKLQRKPYKVKEKEYFGYFVSGIVRDDVVECSFSQSSRDDYAELEKFFKNDEVVFLTYETAKTSDMITKEVRSIMNVYACRIDEEIVDCFPLNFKNRKTDLASLEMILKRIDRQE